MSCQPKDQKTSPFKGRKNFSEDSVSTATLDVQQWWADALRRRYGDHKSAHKTVAEIARCGLRTVKCWFAGESTPQLRHLNAIMAADDQLFADWMESIGRADAAKRALASKKLAEVASLLEGMT